MPQSGTLKVWNEDRGFGFIRPADGSADVFVHVSALPREGPRPLVGEALLFEVEPGRDGKLRALRVRRPGQALRDDAPAAPRPARRPLRRQPERSPVKGLMTLVLAGIVVVSGYTQYTAWQRARSVQTPELPLPTQAPSPPAPSSAASPFRCDGRTHCSQMTSCHEAKYFLAYCPDVKMDGNRDGVPCEQQWCH
jgi:cold shock CspA family protein